MTANTRSATAEGLDPGAQADFVAYKRQSNTRTPAQLREALDAIVEELKALEAFKIADADLVPLVRSVQSVGAYVATIDAQITMRALNGVLLPGVSLKDEIKHRIWNDEELTAELAQEQFGDAAFTRKLKSPAGIEKLGEAGKALVAIASTKPAAGKKAVY